MISNVGLGEENFHSTGALCYIPRGLRPVYYGKRYDLLKQYKHPQYIVDDIRYIYRRDKIMGVTKFAKYSRLLEATLYKIMPFF